MTYSDNPIRRYSEAHPETVVWDAENGWHQTLHNPDGSPAGACWRCGQPLTENERDPESLWFFSAHYWCMKDSGS